MAVIFVCALYLCRFLYHSTRVSHLLEIGSSTNIKENVIFVGVFLQRRKNFDWSFFVSHVAKYFSSLVILSCSFHLIFSYCTHWWVGRGDENRFQYILNKNGPKTDPRPVFFSFVGGATFLLILRSITHTTKKLNEIFSPRP